MSKSKSTSTKSKAKRATAPELGAAAQPRKLSELKRDATFGGNPCIHVRTPAPVLQAFVRKAGGMREAIALLREHMVKVSGVKLPKPEAA